jgi:AcrR family transcriptional regulator
MIAVARGVGVATGTLYCYFPNKQSLCREVFRIFNESEIGVIQNIVVEPNLQAVEKLTVAIETFARRAIKSRQLAWSLIAEPLNTELEEERLYYRRSCAALYAQEVEEGIAQQQFRAQNVAVSASAIVGALAEALGGPLSEFAQQDKTSQCKLPSSRRHNQFIESITAFCLSAVGYPMPNQQK